MGALVLGAAACGRKGERAKGRKGAWAKGRKGERAKGRFCYVGALPSKAISRMRPIKRHQDLEVYHNARKAAAMIFKFTLRFPAAERYCLTSQSRNSSRSVCGNIGEAWRKRRYPAAFRSKLNDAEGEAAETQVWLDTMLDCGYITAAEHAEGADLYDKIIAQLVNTAANADHFCRLP